VSYTKGSKIPWGGRGGEGEKQKGRNPFLSMAVGEVRKQCYKSGLGEKPACIVLTKGKY